MKNLSKFCPDIFKSRLGCVFLIAQLVFCAFILDWEKMLLTVESIEKDRYKSESQETPPSFGCSHCSYNEDYYEVAFVKATFAVFSLPSVLAASYLMVDLKSRHPNWSYEKFVLIGNLAFIIFNSFWWLFLGYLIEELHDYYLRIKSKPENPLAIFSGKN